MDKVQKELLGTYFRKRNIIGNNDPRSRTHIEVEYILKHPESFDIENIRFSKLAWLNDVIKHPEIINKLDLQYNDYRFKYWESEILKYVPELIDLMDIGNIRKDQLIEILKIRPELIKKIPKENLEDIRPYELEDLLMKVPSLADYFDLDKIKNEYVIMELVKKRTELAKKLDLNKITTTYIFMSLIKERPEVIKYVDIQKRNDYADIIRQLLWDGKILYRILKDPEAAERIDFSNANEYLLSVAIRTEPRLIEYIDINNISSGFLFDILESQPKLISHVDINKLHNDDFGKLLIKYPDMINSGYDLSQISSYVMKDILKVRPEFFNNFYAIREKKHAGLDIFNLFTMGELNELISAQPSLEPGLRPYIKRLENKNKWYHG